MSRNVALYYPYIHFRSETWLKTAALYWPRVGRIVPYDYATRDTDAVRMLRDELDLIEDISPDVVIRDVSQRFLQLVEQHSEVLRRRCDVQHLPATRDTSRNTTFADNRVAFIYASKMSYELRDALAEHSLRVNDRGGLWVGVHPDLARVYMCAVAEELSAYYGLHPATDQPGPFAATGAWSLERIARVLLEEPSVAVQQKEAVYDRFLVASLRLVLPKDLSHVPMERIVAARKQSEPLLMDFRNYVEDQVAKLASAQDQPDRTLTADITAQMELTVKNKLMVLDKELRAARLETLSSLVSTKTALPALATVAATAAHIPPEVQGGVAVAAGVAWLARDAGHRNDATVKNSPVGYLHSVRGGVRADSRVHHLLRCIGF